MKIIVLKWIILIMNSQSNRNNINYWNIINEINWYQLSKDKSHKEAVNRVKEFCVKNYDFYTLVDLNNFTWDKKNILKNKIFSFFKTLHSEDKRTKYSSFVSDDFCDDTASHIVGLGETFYNYMIDNIDEIYILTDKVVENFRYGISMAQEELIK